MKLAVTILLAIAVVQASALSAKQQFEKFKVDHKRHYECRELEKLRFNIFTNTLKTIEESNKLYKEGKVTYQLVINDFTDLLSSEGPRGLLVPGEKIRGPPIQEFKKFKAEFHKKYECPQLEALRFKIFQDNLKEIEEHNKDYEQGKSRVKLGTTPFTDALPEEVSNGELVMLTLD